MIGRKTAGGSECTLRKPDPKITVKIIGVRSIILASGARVSDRMQASVMAEACSDIQGICLSRKRAGCCCVGVSVFSRPGVGCRGLAAVKCPVYKRRVVL